MGKWWKSKVFKGIITGVCTAGILVLSAGTAAPAIIGAAAIGTSTGVAVAKNDGPSGIEVGVNINDSGTKVIPGVKI